MRKTLWLLPWSLAALWIPASCSDSETATGTGENPGIPCERDADCADEDVCTFDFCIDGFCQNNVADDGPQAGDAQTDGDCKEVRCEDGASVEVNDDSDEPEDDDDSDCMVPICDNGAPAMGPAEAGENCQVSDNMQGACDGAGTCSCTPSSPDITVYVDGENGTDSTDNGAGRGACAYATLEFALSQAAGEINLTDDLYDSTNTTFPITLTGNQRLRCDYDFQNETWRTTVSGAGTFGAGTATIVFSGTTNRILRCSVDGAGADIAVAIDSAGVADGENHHEIRVTRVTNAVTGVEVTATGDVFLLNEAEIVDNTTTGLLVGAGKAGFLNDNTFSGNGTDILCADASPDLDGQSNGQPSCTGCQNCPFD